MLVLCHAFQYVHTQDSIATVWLHVAGKWMCDVNCTLAAQPCVVLSMGSAGNTDFETGILQRAPHCQVA